MPPTNPQFGTVGWRDESSEGFMYNGSQTGTTTIFRLYNTQSGTHLFTENAGTRATILAQFPGIWVEHNPLGFALAILPAESATQAAAVAAASSVATVRQAVAVTRMADDRSSGGTLDATIPAQSASDEIAVTPPNPSETRPDTGALPSSAEESPPRVIAKRPTAVETLHLNDAVFASDLSEMPWKIE